MADIRTIAANMAHAARNRETVNIGGGTFDAAELKAAADVLNAHAEPLPRGVFWRVNINGFPIELRQENTRRRLFTVAYGSDIRRGLTYSQAAANLGQCIFHALACESLIDNEGT